MIVCMPQDDYNVLQTRSKRQKEKWLRTWDEKSLSMDKLWWYKLSKVVGALCPNAHDANT